MFFVSAKAVRQNSSIVSESLECVRAFSSVGLECHVDIVKVTGSSPVMPIRENKKWGKEMRMSVCLTQPNNIAVIVIVSEHL